MGGIVYGREMTFQNALVAGLFTHSNCRHCRSKLEKRVKTGIQDFAIKVFYAANRCSLLASFLFMQSSPSLWGEL
jgi:hypothetical protein